MVPKCDVLTRRRHGGGSVLYHELIRELCGPGWTRVDPGGPGWTRVDPGGPGWTRVDPGGPGWSRMDIVRIVCQLVKLINN